MIEITSVNQIYSNKDVEKAITSSVDITLFFYNVDGVVPVHLMDNLDFVAMHDDLLENNNVDVSPETIREFVEDMFVRGC